MSKNGQECSGEKITKYVGTFHSSNIKALKHCTETTYFTEADKGIIQHHSNIGVK